MKLREAWDAILEMTTWIFKICLGLDIILVGAALLFSGMGQTPPIFSVGFAAIVAGTDVAVAVLIGGMALLGAIIIGIGHLFIMKGLTRAPEETSRSVAGAEAQGR
jgi:hypothetical protein